MKRKGTYRPTIEDMIEMSAIEMLHPGGFALTRQTAVIAGMAPGMKVLDVSSGRGTQAIYYAEEFGAEVTGIDISPKMVQAAASKALLSGSLDKVFFQQGDSQALPFEGGSFDIVINECAVGIPDDSQSVLNEMVRVAKPGGAVVIHESTWRKKLSNDEKEAFSERYGTTPLEYDQWLEMLNKAGVVNIKTEFDRWSRPEMFWKIRKDRDVTNFSRVLSVPERLSVMLKILKQFGLKGVLTAFENEKVFYQTVLDGKLGYCLFKGEKGLSASALRPF